MNTQPTPRLTLKDRGNGYYDVILEVHYDEYPVTVTLAVNEFEENARRIAYEMQDYLSALWKERS